MKRFIDWACGIVLGIGILSATLPRWFGAIVALFFFNFFWMFNRGTPIDGLIWPWW